MEFKKTNLKKFFETFKTFNVPYYQRNYIWSEQKNSSILKKFIRDLVKAFEETTDTGANYYIGNLAVCNRSEIDIVDGQQRLTSLIIILITLMKTHLSDPMRKKILALLNPSENRFIIEDTIYLKDSLQGLITNTTPNNNISTANQIIKESLDSIKKYSTEKYDKFTEFLLNNIELTYLEFNSLAEAYKYFLNINSFSAPLTELEIFYSFIENIIISTGRNENVKETYVTLIEKLDNDNKWITGETIVEIFLQTYFKSDSLLTELSTSKKKSKSGNGVGRWMIINKDSLLTKLNEGINFLDALKQYIIDLKTILDCFSNTDANTNDGRYKHIYLNHLINKYDNYKYGSDIILNLFVNRNDYNKENIYKPNGKSIDYNKLESYFKLSNATILANLINNRKYTDNLHEQTMKGKQVNKILNNIEYGNVLRYNVASKEELRNKQTSLEYNDKSSVKLLLALQQSFLTSKMSDYSLNSVLYELLDSNKFTVEHLYSINEYAQEARRTKWNDIGMFTSDVQFDRERSSFKNLSLLSQSVNSSLGAKKMSEKIREYIKTKNVKSTNEPEHLVHSLSNEASMYSHPVFDTLRTSKGVKLPNRSITLNMDGCTWNHSENNEDFIKILTELTIEEIFS